MSVEVKVPPLGESITEAVICNLFKESGALVSMDEEILEVETEKVNQVINAPETGLLTLNVKVNDTVKVGQVIATIDTTKKPNGKPEKAPSPETPKPETPKPETPESGTQLSEEKKQPIAKEEAPLEKGVESQKIKKSEEESLKEIQSEKPSPQEKATTTSSKERPGEKRERMTALRKTIAKRLVEVKNQTAMLTTFNEVDMSAVIDFRKKEQENFQKKHGVKLGFMSFFVKAAVAALKEYPAINASIDEDEIVYQQFYHIGIAVGSKRGLMVPVVKDCDRKKFFEIEKSLKELATKAREGKLSIPELEGGSFTITNGGIYGSMLSTPILNPPQSGILGMHNIISRPVALDGKVMIRPMMYLALSYDHRIVDGEQAIGFLVHIKNNIEDPTRLLVDL